MKLQPVKEFSVTSEDLGIAVSENVVRKAKSGSNLVTPTELESCRKLVVRRNIFFFNTNSQIKGQPFERLILVLNVNCLVQIAATAHLSEALKHTASDRIWIRRRRTILQRRTREGLAHAIDPILAVAKEDRCLVAGIEIIKDRH